MRFKRILIVVTVALFVLALLTPSAVACPPCTVGSPGYWMNHPEAWDALWYTDEILGLTRDEAIAFMQSNSKHDKTITLFRQYAAASLNQFGGCDTSCPIPGTGWTVQDIIWQAGGWLTDNPPGSGVRANTEPWQNGGEWKYEWLDKYNNGELCVPARD